MSAASMKLLRPPVAKAMVKAPVSMPPNTLEGMPSQHPPNTRISRYESLLAIRNVWKLWLVLCSASAALPYQDHVGHMSALRTCCTETHALAIRIPLGCQIILRDWRCRAALRCWRAKLTAVVRVRAKVEPCASLKLCD
eukprot:6174029-Pleurochrysis_carterae.AAC.5